MLKKSRDFDSVKKISGFSLIEVMLVLGIIAVLVVMGSSRLQRRQTNIKTSVREFTLLGKEIRNHTRLYNLTLRLVINLNKEEPTYSIEASNKSGSSYVDAAAMKKLSKGELKDDDPDHEKAAGYKPYAKILKKPRTLPSGFYFKQVETQSYEEPITEGKAYVHFFPDGHLEASAIQITDGKNLTWTIIYHPLTGQADIIQKAQALRDIER